MELHSDNSDRMATTALVTGGNGFYGRHLTRRLIDDGWVVHATSRESVEPANEELTFHKVDVSRLEDAETVVDSVAPDIIFHLSGSASAATDVDLVLPTHHSQVTSTLNILTIAARRRAVRRLVLVGSLMEPAGDVSEVVPSSAYSAAKLSVVHYGKMFHFLYDLPVVSVRPFMTFGPMQADGHVLPFVIRSLASGNAPSMTSGKWQADWIYVDDVVDGLVRAATSDSVAGEVLDLGSGTTRSVRQIVERVAELMNADVAPLFGALPDRPGEPTRVADIKRTKMLTGWEPKVDLDTGLRRTVEWYVKKSVSR